jgi:Hypothetical protein (DUF2513)
MRDLDLIREILLMVEAAATDRGFSFEEGEAETLKRTLDEIRYNIEVAEKMGLIEVGSKPLNGEWIIRRLTPNGHDFLERSQNSEPNQISSVKLTALDNEVPATSAKTQGELFILKPSFSGMGIDLKELWRRVRSFWQR